MPDPMETIQTRAGLESTFNGPGRGDPTIPKTASQVLGHRRRS